MAQVEFESSGLVSPVLSTMAANITGISYVENAVRSDPVGPLADIMRYSYLIPNRICPRFSKT
jgi:hypothetical protein